MNTIIIIFKYFMIVKEYNHTSNKNENVDLFLRICATPTIVKLEISS